LEQLQTVQDAKICQVSFKVLALDGVAGNLFFEVPEGEISKMFLTDLNNVRGM